MNTTTDPKPCCAAPRCRRTAVTGKIYCFVHAKLAAAKFYRQWKERAR